MPELTPIGILMTHIRPANPDDFDAIWGIFQPIVAAGTTYAYPTDTSKDQARAIWLEAPRATFVAEVDGRIAGTYYLKTNQGGNGDHVCNCGYMVADHARGKGLAAAMCDHSQDHARRLGYQAMQFNFVIETNTGAIALWQRLGFETVGRIPDAFRHPEQGYVAALVMYKWLDADRDYSATT